LYACFSFIDLFLQTEYFTRRISTTIEVIRTEKSGNMICTVLNHVVHQAPDGLKFSLIHSQFRLPT